MSLSTQQIIDVVGASTFSLSALVFGGFCLLNGFTNACQHRKMPGVCIKLLGFASIVSLIQAFAYWAAFGGYGSTLRAADNVTIQWAVILTWPFSWFYVGKALGTYLLHQYHWKSTAAYLLALAGLAHYLGAYIGTNTPGIQTAAYVLGLAATLGAVFVAFVYRRRRDTASTIALVVGVIGVVAGFYLSYLLAEYFLNIVTGTGFSIWLLIANIVVYIAYFAYLIFTARDPVKRAD